MTVYADSADLQPRMPFREIGASTKPTATEVDLWITEAEGKLHGALKAAQIGTPITDSDGIHIMASWVLSYAEGRVLIAYGSTGSEDERRAGQELVDKFEALIKEIKVDPALYSGMLEGGTADAATVRIRSHVTHHPDGQTVAAGDFDPQFTRRDHRDEF